MDHITKYEELAIKIDKEYFKLCSRYNCEECKYNKTVHCKTLFILEYLEDNDMLSNNGGY